MELKYFEEQIFFATLRIEATDPASNRGSVGTGFMVRAPVPGHPSSNIVALVTCKHVLFGGKGTVTMVAHRKDPASASSPLFSQPLVVGPADYAEAYFEHDDASVDVAAINFTGLFLRLPIFSKTVSRDHAVDFQNEHLVPGSDVVFIGYPIGLYDQASNLPILRGGRIATIPKVDFNGKPEFLIDAQVFPGSSGSPVFVLNEGKYMLVGMLGESVVRNAQVELVKDSRTPVVRDFIGLGIVYKHKAIFDVVSKLADATARALQLKGNGAATPVAPTGNE